MIYRIGEVVRVYEVVTGIVGRVEIDHLHPAEIRPVDNLECLKVVASDEGVLRFRKVDAFIHIGNQRCARGGLEHHDGVAPPGPM